MSDDNLFKHESVQDLDSLIAYLEAVSEGFRRRRLAMSDKDGELVLEPHGLIKFDIEAKCKGQSCKLVLKFSWKERQGEPEDDALSIEAG
jgi:amphi-Trp domain-containing protein